MQRARRSTAWILSSSVTLAAATALGADWSQWRGTHGDARAPDFVAPQSWPKQLTPKWKVPVGEGVATPALVGDRLYVFSRQNNQEVIRCLDAATGTEIWQDKYDAQGATGPAASYSGPRSSPAVAEGKVVTLGVRGMLSCYDAATGKKLWRKDDFQGAVPMFFVSSSPVIDAGMVVAQLGGKSGGGIVAYDLATGDQKWKWSGDGPAYASPALMDVDGMKLIIAMTERRMVAVTEADGKLVWEAPFGGAGPGAYNASTPVIDGQTLIYSGGGRGTHAVRFEKRGDGVEGKEIWSNNEKSVQFNSPIVKDGMLYGLSAQNELFCLDAKTGKQVWGGPTLAGGGGGFRGGGDRPGGFGRGGPTTQPAGAGGPTTRPAGGEGSGPPNGPNGGRRFGGGGPGGPAGGGGMRGGGGGMRGGGYGNIIDAGSVVMAITPAAELLVFTPGDKYTEVAKIKVSSTPTNAYPVVSGNRMFIKDQDSVSLLILE